MALSGICINVGENEWETEWLTRWYICTPVQCTGNLLSLFSIMSSVWNGRWHIQIDTVDNLIDTLCFQLVLYVSMLSDYLIVGFSIMISVCCMLYDSLVEGVCILVHYITRIIHNEYRMIHDLFSPLGSWMVVVCCCCWVMCVIVRFSVPNTDWYTAIPEW